MQKNQEDQKNSTEGFLFLFPSILFPSRVKAYMPP